MRTAEEKLKFKQELETRTMKFAVSVFAYLDALPKAMSLKVISFQLGKSASSIGANYREANRGSSPADFANKIAIVLKECAESQYWLEVLSAVRPKNQGVEKLLSECKELLMIFQTIDRRMHTIGGGRARSAASAIRRFDDSTDSTIVQRRLVG